MTHYAVNVSLRNKAGKEHGRRAPLWQGDAADVRDALKAATELLLPLVTAEVDAIVLTAVDSKGGRTTATEYAEDITGAKGMSLGSSLLDANADHGLSPAELQRAQHELDMRALKAMPLDYGDQGLNASERMGLPKDPHGETITIHPGFAGPAQGPDVFGVDTWVCIETTVWNEPGFERKEIKRHVHHDGTERITTRIYDINGNVRHEEVEYETRHLGDSKRTLKLKGKLVDFTVAPATKDEYTPKAKNLMPFILGNFAKLNAEQHRLQHTVLVSQRIYQQLKDEIGMGPNADLTGFSGIKVKVEPHLNGQKAQIIYL